MLLSFLIAGVAGACAALCYAEFAGMVLYTPATLVLTGMQHYTEISPTSGFATAFDSVGMPGVANIIAVGAIAGIVTVVLTFMLGVTRVWYAMSRDGLLPQWFAKTHPTRRVHPCHLDRRDRLGDPGGVAAHQHRGGADQYRHPDGFHRGRRGVRYGQPREPRRFRLPLMPVMPIMGIGFSAYLIWSLPRQTWARFASWLVLGLVIYFTYSHTHSKPAHIE